MGSPEVGPCDRVQANVWQYLDHEIDQMSCAELEAHLAGCPDCQRAVEFDRRFKEVLRRCVDAQPLSQDRVRVMAERVRRRLASAPPPEVGHAHPDR